MKKYEKPVVMINEELAEGVYAASGMMTGPTGTQDCWSFDVYPVQDWNGSHRVFEIKLRHHTGLEHISDASNVSVTFDRDLKDAYTEFGGTFDGSRTVSVSRVLLADAYKDGDWVTYKIWAQASDEATTRSVAVSNVTVTCDKSLNVQGGGASEINP